MDTTKTYIEMCEKAAEIQEHQLVYGDYFYGLSYNDDKPGKQIFIWCDWITRNNENNDLEIFDGGYEWETQNIDLITWLPRQDQLQEMIDWECIEISKGYIDDEYLNNKYGFNKLYHMDCELCLNKDLNYDFELDSIEQCWLSFVMYKKYNKQWKDEEWK